MYKIKHIVMYEKKRNFFNEKLSKTCSDKFFTHHMKSKKNVFHSYINVYIHNRACAFEYKSSLVHLCSVSPPFLRKVYCFLVRNGTQKKNICKIRVKRGR